MEFRTVDEASYAIDAMNGYQFDAKHQFKCNKFSDIEKFANLDEAYEEPEVEEFQPRVRQASHK
jgi:translation initiation factor 3 subunit B